MPNGKRSAPLSPLQNNKKRKYASKYKEAWKVKYPWVKHSATEYRVLQSIMSNTRKQAE